MRNKVVYEEAGRESPASSCAYRAYEMIIVASYIRQMYHLP